MTTPISGQDVIELVATNHLPKILIQLVDGDGNPRDVSAPGKTITARFREKGSDTTLFEASCAKYTGGYDGCVLLTFPDSLDYAAGRYEAQITVTEDSLDQSAWNTVQFRILERFAAP